MGGQVLDYEAERILNEGRADDCAEGLAEGKIETEYEVIRNLMDTTGWSMEKIMDAMKIPMQNRYRYTIRLNGNADTEE